jgi:hypothetical protein
MLAYIAYMDPMGILITYINLSYFNHMST